MNDRALPRGHVSRSWGWYGSRITGGQRRSGVIPPPTELRRYFFLGRRHELRLQDLQSPAKEDRAARALSIRWRPSPQVDDEVPASPAMRAHDRPLEGFLLRSVASLGPHGTLVFPKPFRRSVTFLREATRGDDAVRIGEGAWRRLSDLLGERGGLVRVERDLIGVTFAGG